MPAIETRDLTKRYGDVTALAGVDLSIEAGDAVGVVGTNGAGKTTLFRLLVGHERPDGGRIRVCDRDPTEGTAVRRQVGYLPQDAGFHPTLTGREVLSFHASMRGVPSDRRKRRVRRVLATVGLADAADRRVGGYSGGMERRLGLGTVLVTRPSVLLLDEPTAGLDPGGVAAFNDVVERVREATGITVVLATHALSEVERLCDRAVVLDDGEVRAAGSVEELSVRAGDTVTVEARLAAGADPAAVEALRDRFGAASVAVRRRDGDRDVGSADGSGDGNGNDGPTTASPGAAEGVVRGPSVTIECPREDAFDVVAAVHDRAEVASFEVQEPGLAAAFREATDADVAADGGETA